MLGTMIAVGLCGFLPFWLIGKIIDWRTSVAHRRWKKGYRKSRAKE